jgi:hypothetical protein
MIRPGPWRSLLRPKTPTAMRSRQGRQPRLTNSAYPLTVRVRNYSCKHRGGEYTLDASANDGEYSEHFNYQL